MNKYTVIDSYHNHYTITADHFVVEGQTLLFYGPRQTLVAAFNQGWNCYMSPAPISEEGAVV